MPIQRKELRKHEIIGFVFALITISWVSCSTSTQEDTIRWVTLEEIAKSLKNLPPMNVGFDVDDTVLFSTPGYYYGEQKYSPGSNAYLQIEEFWYELNNGLDQFSLPKECARKLIDLHKKRGDTIFFITARTPTQTETVTELLAKTFDIENLNKVIFTGAQKGFNRKIKPIRENNIQIYYGDSDSDIEAAQAVGIRGIRIMRVRYSTKRPFPKNGSLGEEVLINSDF